MQIPAKKKMNERVPARGMGCGVKDLSGFVTLTTSSSLAMLPMMQSSHHRL
jgi:hypothetical protein